MPAGVARRPRRQAVIWHPTFHKHWFFRRIVKRALRGVGVTVKSGPLKGKRWLFNARREFRRGTYEPDQSRIFAEVLKEGQVVYDLGAHIGYYTVLASALVGPSGHVVSFEPLPANLQDLRRHLQMNGCDNVTVIEACVAEHTGTCSFARRRATRAGAIAPDGQLTMPMVSLDELVDEGTIPAPDCMKIDVEGSEFAALQGARSLIARTHPTILLSVHGDELRAQCLDFLSAHAYQLCPVGANPLAEAVEILAMKAD